MIESPFSTREGYAMTENSVVQLRQPGSLSEDPLTVVLRSGARRRVAIHVVRGTGLEWRDLAFGGVSTGVNSNFQ